MFFYAIYTIHSQLLLLELLVVTLLELLLETLVCDHELGELMLVSLMLLRLLLELTLHELLELLELPSVQSLNLRHLQLSLSTHTKK